MAAKATLSKKIFVVPSVANASETQSKTVAAKLKPYILATVSVLAILIVAGAVFTLFSYWHYEKLVEQRLANGFWATRSGIYSAPRTLRAGQKTSAAELADVLRRAGYVENAQSDVWSGSFAIQNNAVVIQRGAAFYNQPAVKVNFNADGRIKTVSEEGGATLKEFALTPELLTDESGAKSTPRQTLDYKDLPQPLVKAILAIEDHRFHEHSGVDAKAAVRAAWTNLTGGAMRQGGSTITQQLVKNTFLNSDRTLQRKFSEALIAVALERRLSKEAIFALYCNEIYLGQRGAVVVNGVEQAARVYFGKTIDKLTLGEAAMIAAIIKSPRRFSPDLHRAAAIERRNLVLDNMVLHNFVSQAEADAAQAEELTLAPIDNAVKPFGAHFVDAVKAQLDGNENMAGWRVQTTIDAQLQQTARAVINKHLENLSRRYDKAGKLQAALVAIDPKTGNVLAMVGGRDYAASQLNRSVDTYRQPGSTFKPIVYAAALENGKSPAARYSDSPTEFIYAGGQKYKPKNYGGGFSMQPVTVKTALVKSLNTVTVGLAMETGLSTVSRYAALFGLPVKDVYPSMALGTEEASPLQIASAYTVFANGGMRSTPAFVTAIVGGDGRQIYQHDARQSAVVSPETAYIITDMLTDAVNNGTARSAKGALGKNVFAGKTGTANDGWFVGYTPNLVVAVWVGFDENKDLNLTGADSALPIWTEFMKTTVDARPELGGHNFPAPADLRRVTIDPETGMLAGASCPHRETVILHRSVTPNVECLMHDHRYNQPQEYDIPVDTQLAAVTETPAQPPLETDRQVASAVTIKQSTVDERARTQIQMIQQYRVKRQNAPARENVTATADNFR